MNNTINGLKALGIILMVIGHCGCSIPQLVPFIYMFHMPLFFFVSGYCFKRDNLMCPCKYAIKKIKSIYWPYVKWGILFILLHNFFCKLHIYDNELYSGKEMIVRIFYNSYQMADTEQLLGGYWFLAALFTGTFVAWILLKTISKIEMGGGIALIISVIFNLVPDINSSISILKFFPMGLQLFGARTFEAAFFIITGHWFAQKKIKPFSWLIILICLILTLVGSFYWKINSGDMYFDNKLYLPYLCTAILSVWSIYSIIEKLRIAEYPIGRVFDFIGKNTLTVLTWHFLAFKSVSIMIIRIYSLPISRLSDFPTIHEYSARGWWIVYFIVAMIVCCCLAYCNKWIKSQWLKL